MENNNIKHGIRIDDTIVGWKNGVWGFWKDKPAKVININKKEMDEAVLIVNKIINKQQ